MKQVRGFWLPDDEEHLKTFLEQGSIVYGGPTYQYAKLAAALKLIPANRRGRAVDVGAHCGLWSRVLVNEFAFVDAFEPVPRHRECFEANLRPYANWRLRPLALGNRLGPCTLTSERHSSGGTFIEGGPGPYPETNGETYVAEMSRIDTIGFVNMDFLKIDCEGYEYHVLLGGEKTIRTLKPYIIVEQKPKNNYHGIDPTAACKLLQSWGAKQQFMMAGDYFYSW